jgi:hypothetical protein
MHPRDSIGRYWPYPQRDKMPIHWEYFARAIDNLSKFSLVLILEWINLPISQQLIEDKLGWAKPVEHVMPRADMFKRNMSQPESIWENVSISDYNEVARENVFDILFFEIAKRIFLERVICK